MNEIRLKGPVSTVAAMEYIRDHGFVPNEYGNMYFEFPDDCSNQRVVGIPIGMQPRYLIASKQNEEHFPFLDLHPLEEWHDVFGMKRYCCGEKQWYLYINGEYYFMSC